ncbi:acetamidase/formamidase family protein [Brachybacterium sp. GPGPB12]|uniref:acetamidase/formamidase family protein n=1 Tax=Brachybacterium sp. GPGPB12 TaxID=3023517 RepID=UPI00313433CE
MGVAVPGTERPHSVPPGRHGGNIDINLLTAGTSLYLPVQVEGALAYVGDPHFAQGDGEVALTAMEASLRDRLRLDVIAREDAIAQFGEVAGPLAETTEYLIPTGMDEDLDLAVKDCVRHAIAAAPGPLGPGSRACARLPQRRHRLRHLPGRRRRQGRPRPHPHGRLRGGPPMSTPSADAQITIPSGAVSQGSESPGSVSPPTSSRTAPVPSRTAPRSPGRSRRSGSTSARSWPTTCRRSTPCSPPARTPCAATRRGRCADTTRSAPSAAGAAAPRSAA